MGMADPIYISTQEDVLERLGPPEVQRQLLDPNKTGTLNMDAVDRARRDSGGDVEAALGARFVRYADGEWPQKLVRIDTDLAVRYVYKHARAPAPKEVIDVYNDALRQLERLEAGLSGPGTPIAQSRLTRIIDNSDGGRRGVYRTLRRGGLNGGR